MSLAIGRSTTVMLVDVDGTLIDSNDAHARAWVEVLTRHGHAARFEQVRPLIGKGGDKLLEEVVGFDDETAAGKQMAEERRALFSKRYLPSLQPTRGARALLLRLRELGLRVVVATSAGADEVKGLLQQAGIDDLVDQQATSSDADRSKPDPDIVEAAIRRARVGPDACLMLGDTPYDVAAAQAAGVGTIVLRCGGWWKDESFAGARAIYDDPQALLDALNGS